jgi:UDP-N-acetylmuramate: L-alanyl-gamma-D-glutamyl-meso-diaminopimelate ligase
MKKIHFIAIGGSAMHSLAIALHQKGIQVTGSDDAIFEPSKSKLQALGLLPEQLGWDAKKITPDLDAVVLGMHAKKDNPELQAAIQLGIQIYSYPELLYALTKEKTRVVIAGSHGKTTTTAMVLHVMNYCEREVDFMIGAPLEGYDNAVHLTDNSDFVVLEGDEYLSSPMDSRSKFLWYQPQIALITGIAWDHVNVFPTYEAYEAPFKEFIESISEGGVLVFNAEDEKVAALVENTSHRIRNQAYTTPEHDIVNGTTRLFTDEGPLPLAVFGQHNLSNLAGAQWICQLMGIDPSIFCEAITSFKGASRRLEVLYDGKHQKLYKDFAHAPSKVKATTASVKSQFPQLQLLACLELHTYSSLDPNFIAHYKGTLASADEALVFYDPEALRIKNREVLPPEAITAAFEHPNLKVFTRPEMLHHYLLGNSYEDTFLLMMSSGNYGQLDWEALKTRVANASFGDSHTTAQ